MSLAIIIPVLVVGLLVGSEYLMARNSKWEVLAQKFRNAANPPNGWHGCRFVQMEIREGNVLKRTIYGHGYSKPGLDALWAQMFPKVLVSAGPAGLYLKRQPWNFRHSHVLIPWSRFSSLQSISGTQHVTESAGRGLGFAGKRFRENMPNAVTGIIDKLTGDVVELRLSDPNVRIELPASAIGNWQQYAPKSKEPARRPASPVGAV